MLLLMVAFSQKKLVLHWNYSWDYWENSNHTTVYILTTDMKPLLILYSYPPPSNQNEYTIMSALFKDYKVSKLLAVILLYTVITE